MIWADFRFQVFKPMTMVAAIAPTCESATDYDRRHLAMYAALLDADEAGADWQSAAVQIMGLDENVIGAEQCWHTHLVRARWIIEEGLGSAIAAFGRR